MKIALPVTENSKMMKINHVLGRTPYFYIYDLETKEEKYIDNIAKISEGGAGVKAIQLLADKDVNVLITFKCGDHAKTALDNANIKIYSALNDSVWDNIEALIRNRLILMKDPNVICHHEGN